MIHFEIIFSILNLNWLDICRIIGFSVSSEVKTKLKVANVNFVHWWILFWRWNCISWFYIVCLYMTTWLKLILIIPELTISGSLDLAKTSTILSKKTTVEPHASILNASKVWRTYIGQLVVFNFNKCRINNSKNWTRSELN